MVSLFAVHNHMWLVVCSPGVGRQSTARGTHYLRSSQMFLHGSVSSYGSKHSQKRLFTCCLPHSYSVYHETDNKTGLHPSVYLCIHLFLLSWLHFLIDFYQNWPRHKNPKSKNQFAGSTSHHLFPYFATPKKNLVLKRFWKSLQILIILYLP